MNYHKPPSPRAGTFCQGTSARPSIIHRRGLIQSTVALVAAAGLHLAANPVQAAVATFEEFSPNTPLSTAPGWSASAPDLSPSFPFAWVADTGTSKAGAIGGYYEVPAGTTYSATVADSLPIITSGQYYSEVSLDIAIIDSSNTYPDRDQFGFTVNDSTGSPTISVDFRPVVQTATPATLVGLWEVIYTVRGGVAVNTTVSLAESTGYSFKVTYQAGGVALSFGSSALENTFTAIPTTYLPATQSITGVSLTWNKPAGTTAFGDNYLIVDNIAVAVPEPSVAAALGAAGLVLMSRRRRVFPSTING